MIPAGSIYPLAALYKDHAVNAPFSLRWVSLSVEETP